jgi:hypothetical protein
LPQEESRIATPITTIDTIFFIPNLQLQFILSIKRTN